MVRYVALAAKKQQHEITTYRCKAAPLRGHRFVDIMPQVRKEFRTLQKRTKRRPHVRSDYFKKNKIFFDYFWQHMQRKSVVDRARRLKYFPCALEVLRKSRHNPTTFVDINQPDIIKHEFVAIAPDGVRFSVIIQEDRKTDKKQLLSLYPSHP